MQVTTDCPMTDHEVDLADALVALAEREVRAATLGEHRNRLHDDELRRDVARCLRAVVRDALRAELSAMLAK